MNQGKKLALSAGLTVGLLGILAIPTFGASESLSTIAVKIKYFAKNGKFPAKHVAYSNTKSGLKAGNVQAAIDELGSSLAEVISKGTVTASGVRSASLSGSTWKGHYYSRGGSSDLAVPSEEITIIFTPETSTTGTFTSSPLYAINPKGNSLTQRSDDVTAICSDPQGTFTGKYEIVGDNLLYTLVTAYDGSAQYCGPQSKAIDTLMFVKGNTITFSGGTTLPAERILFQRQ